MLEFFRKLLSSDFMPHGHCYFWRPEIVWLHVLSDAMIALAYYSIPFTLLYFVRRRRHIEFRGLFLMFASFILFCGTTHLMQIYNLWFSAYRLEGLIKFLTGVVSVITAAVLVRLMPQALNIPSPAALAEVNSQLESQIRRFRSLLEAAPDSMVIINADHNIEIVNSQAERMFGYGRDILSGQAITKLFETEFPVAVDSPVEVTCVSQSGRRFPCEVTVSPLETEQGTLLTAAIRDISDRKQAEQEIRQLNNDLERRVLERTAELERSNADLRQFAYAASHDMKEPLRMVSIYSQLLSRNHAEALGPQALEMFGIVISSAQRMEQLLSDLLLYSQTAETMPPPASNSARDALDLALANLDLSITQTGTMIDIGPLPTVRAHRSLLVQLFQNLIANAIKYRRDDPLLISIYAEQDGAWWRFHVRDNGIGVPPQYREHIFGIFKRLHGPRYPGTGIGLALCQRIVERYGGKIWVDSPSGEGSDFQFTLPA